MKAGTPIRHLDQLHCLFRINRVNWIAETVMDLPEDFPAIEAVTIELRTN